MPIPDANFDANFSTLNRFETVENDIFSLHQTAKNPGNQGFPGFFKYGPEGNRIYVQSPETPMFPCFSNIIRQNFTAALTTTAVTKDRVLGHNPVAALYTADSYYSKLKKSEEE